MALQTSGAISILNLVSEFGGTAPHSLSEYYRGGSLVPDTPTNSGVPTSGAISLTDFYGAAAYVPDVTPNAVNWTNLSGSYTNFTNITTNTQTISGIDTTITLNYSDNIPVGTLAVFVNGVNPGGTGDFTVSSGDTVYFRWTVPSGTQSGTVTIINKSDGDAVIDTFTITTTGTGF